MEQLLAPIVFLTMKPSSLIPHENKAAEDLLSPSVYCTRLKLCAYFWSVCSEAASRGLTQFSALGWFYKASQKANTALRGLPEVVL